MAGFAILLLRLRAENKGHHPIGIPFDYEPPLVDKVLDYTLDGFLILIITIAVITGIWLVVNKDWGRLLGMYLGGILTVFGVFLLVLNLQIDGPENGSIFERFINLFTYMGANLAYIDFVCIIYGIFIIVYFKRPNVRRYFTE